MERIKINRIVLENFESHAKSEILFDDGFSCLTGASCSGKSSILRSLRSIIQPRGFLTSFVREGQPFSKIRVETSAGFIECKKGEGVNELDYFIIGETPEPVSMRAPGEKSFEVAQKITGLSTMRIESTGVGKAQKRVDVGLMSQDDPTGILAESSRNKANLFDSLAGICDSENIRLGLSNGVTLRKKKMDESVTLLTSIKSGAVDEHTLQTERDSYNADCDSYDDLLVLKKKIEEIVSHQDQHSTAVVQIQEFNTKLAEPALQLPEGTLLAEFRDNSPKRVHCLQLLSELHQKHQTIGADLGAYSQTLSSLTTIEASQIEAQKKNSTMLDFIGRYNTAVVQMESIGRDLELVGSVGDVSLLVELLGKYLISKRWYDTEVGLKKIKKELIDFSFVQVDIPLLNNLIETILEARKLYGRMTTLSSAVGTFSKDLKDVCNTLDSMLEERMEMLDKVIVCPVTGKGIGEKCSLFEEKQKAKEG